jgi:hypothetical protein
MNNYIMNLAKNEAHQQVVRNLRLAHARHMETFDRYIKEGNIEEAGYWLQRASETHQRLLDLGEVAI